MPPTPHPCDQEHRLEALERRNDDHSERIRRAETSLGDGRVQFAELRKDLQAATAALEHLAERVEQALADRGTQWGAEILKAVIFWAVPVVCGGMLWAIVKSGAVHP